MANICASQQPEIVGIFMNPITAKALRRVKKVRGAIEKSLPYPKAGIARKLFSPKQIATQSYNKALAAIRRINGQMVGAYATILPALNNLESQWMIVHGLFTKKLITEAMKHKAALEVVATRAKAANVYAADANAHYPVMIAWSKSTDFPALEQAYKNYANWITFMNKDWTASKNAPYTHAHKIAQDAHAGINAAWQALHANYEAQKARVQQEQQNIEAAWPTLLKQLGLEMSASPETVMATWAEKYQSDPKDVEAYRSMLADAGISPTTSVAGQIGFMIEFIKSKKKKNVTKIVGYAAGVAALGVAAAAFT